ncbi:MAG: NlpC/P60 family protein [Alphaproteobacteria bacterium]
MCKQHWYSLPKDMRDAVCEKYQTGQEISKTPSREFVGAAREAINHLKETDHWANKLIGIPYDITGSDPVSGFNCWSFVRYVQAKYYGRNLPEIPNPTQFRAITKEFSAHAERARWQKIDDPQDGDLILTCLGAHPCHVGVYIALNGGGILHCVNRVGVQFHRIDMLTLGGWTLQGFYRFVGEST